MAQGCRSTRSIAGAAAQSDSEVATEVGSDFS